RRVHGPDRDRAAVTVATTGPLPATRQLGLPAAVVAEVLLRRPGVLSVHQPDRPAELADGAEVVRADHQDRPEPTGQHLLPGNLLNEVRHLVVGCSHEREYDDGHVVQALS